MNGPGAHGAALANAFKADLLNQGSVALFIFVLLAFAWVTSREAMPARARARLAVLRATATAEPPARRLLRIGFGVLWVFDGLLQAQPAMPSQLLSRVVGPAADGSPAWVAHLVGWAGAAWSHHPIQAAASVVWLQIGIGLWLISAPRGRWSRVAALVSACWGLIVWVFGEAFGSLFGSGLSWLTGAPGAALFYAAAGALLAMPQHRWQDPRLGRGLLRAAGLFLCCMAVLQAWPGRGFWHGTLDGQPGTLAATVQSMSAMHQPASVARLIGGFGSFVAANGFAVNLVAVIMLACTGVALLTGRRAIVRVAVIVVLALCVADWVLIQDFGFFGGVGTDPNSMIPFGLVVLAGYLAARAAPLPAAQAVCLAGQPAGSHPPRTAAQSGPELPGWRPLSLRRPRPLLRSATVALGTASSSAVIALWAVGLVGLGAIPLAVAEMHFDAAPVAAGVAPRSAVSAASWPRSGLFLAVRAHHRANGPGHSVGDRAMPQAREHAAEHAAVVHDT